MNKLNIKNISADTSFPFRIADLEYLQDALATQQLPLIHAVSGYTVLAENVNADRIGYVIDAESIILDNITVGTNVTGTTNRDYYILTYNDDDFAEVFRLPSNSVVYYNTAPSTSWGLKINETTSESRVTRLQDTIQLYKDRELALCVEYQDENCIIGSQDIYNYKQISSLITSKGLKNNLVDNNAGFSHQNTLTTTGSSSFTPTYGRPLYFNVGNYSWVRVNLFVRKLSSETNPTKIQFWNSDYFDVNSTAQSTYVYIDPNTSTGVYYNQMVDLPVNSNGVVNYKIDETTNYDAPNTIECTPIMYY